MKRLLQSAVTLYGLRLPGTIAYMLQSTEYKIWPYLLWFWRTNDFSNVKKRRDLDKTKVANLITMAVSVGVALQLLAAMVFLILWQQGELVDGWLYGLILSISYPVVWAHLIIIVVFVGNITFIKPQEKKLLTESEEIFSKHPATIIAVAGSYGKTSMKELLLTVLSEGKKVAATPANKNVASSHAIFAKQLSGDEDVLIIEYGESAPGDVARFAATTHPDIGIITGLAPAHLDKYKTLKAAGKDIFTLGTYLRNKPVFVNIESQHVSSFIKSNYISYSKKSVGKWRIDDIKITNAGTSFAMKKGKVELKLSSKLLGAHQVGPLVVVANIAFELGLNIKQIESGVAKTTAFEHRMQPRLVAGALVVDDTYNGNIEGVRVGLELLSALKGKRKIYITPGLVDQGEETKSVHVKMGQLIARTEPDVVVLMRNSVTEYIKQGLGGFKGEVIIQDDPLMFYTNIDQFVASGDIVLMQNDWTDNYS